MKSLKAILLQHLKNRQHLSTWECEAIAKEAHFKISNYERRMRELCEEREGFDPEVMSIKNNKGVITGYKLFQKGQATLF